MVDNVPLGEQCEGVKQLEDGVAGLVDRHDHNPVTHLAQAVVNHGYGNIVLSKPFPTTTYAFILN